MALKIYDTLVPQGDYPAVTAENVEMSDGTRLSNWAPPASDTAGVKTVNGVAPDEDGNVEIQIPEPKKELPGVTSADDGKVLTVEDGKFVVKEPSGGASSWNDLTDKPFYEEDNVVVILKEQMFQGFLDGETLVGYAVPIVVGEIYTVVWDGTEYLCEAQDGSTMGGAGAVILGSGEPFVIMTSAVQNATLITALDENGANIDTSSETHTVGICRDGIIVKTLDTKYLAPFYKGTDKVNVIETQSMSLMYNSIFGAFMYSCIANDVNLNNGQDYDVVWDGVEYKRTAFQFMFADSSLCTALGNPVITGDENNNDPFAIVFDSTNGFIHFISVVDTAVTSHTAAVSREETVWKLKEKCFPMDAIDARIKEYINSALEGDY